ncbi:copper resistance D family protein [Mycobacterium deserti]|uniref:CopD family protein n=1 Tax=Mycobacterium deserti TaxID=2978347 RepID=A0ABT2MHQ6_9MYCO|nr:CopD family protein [Mycobacterium deserti]MCT7661541.1 CopD family protein [Mycobacterium deserti]
MWRVAAAGAAVVGAASVATWSLAYPQASPTATLVRAVADCAAAVALGVAAVPALDTARHRRELMDRAAAPLAVATAVWLLAELTRFLLAAAQAGAISVGTLGLATTVEFALGTATGRAGLVGVAAATAACATVLIAPRSIPTHLAAAGLIAIGVAARPLTGHFADSALGGLAVAVHTLAAVLWCGVLAGLVLTVEHRGQWARVLPRFSQLSLVCVLALVIGGAAGAAAQLGTPADLYATGYGRVLSAKIAVTALLVTLGWRNRTMWLPAARSHRATALVSRARSRTELAIMVVALALAAGLAVTG